MLTPKTKGLSMGSRTRFGLSREGELEEAVLEPCPEAQKPLEIMELALGVLSQNPLNWNTQKLPRAQASASYEGLWKPPSLPFPSAFLFLAKRRVLNSSLYSLLLRTYHLGFGFVSTEEWLAIL